MKYGTKVVEVKFAIRQRDIWGQSEALNRANDQLEKQIPGQMSIYDYYK